MPFNQNEIPNFAAGADSGDLTSSDLSSNPDYEVTDDDMSDAMSTQDDRQEDVPNDQVAKISASPKFQKFSPKMRIEMKVSMMKTGS